MEDFKKSPKIACFKEGGQVGYKSRKEHSESKEMSSDIKKDKKIVKKAFSIHDAQQHEEKTDLSKLKKGGRAKKCGGTVRKYKAGGVIETIKDIGSRLKDNVMGTEEQNAAAQARMDAAAATKGQGAVSDVERAMATKKGQGAVSDAERAMVTKKRGGKC
jgi:hypothetical protein